jgi:hypothetical protein
VPETVSEPSDRGLPPEDLSVAEIAELEAGTAGVMSPLLARLDVIVTALICLAAALLSIIMPQLVVSGGIAIGRSYATMSPSLIPRIIFGVLAAFAAVATIAAVKRFRQSTTENPGDELDRFSRAAIVAVIILFYALSVTWLGYILSTMIAAAVISYFLGLRNPLAYIPAVVIVPIVIRFIFERMLFISLPRSRIESVGQLEDQLIRFLVNTLLG